MNESVDKHIENLVDKAMKKSTLETPSFDFTANVMSHVVDIKQSIATTYQPLISRRVWIVIAFGIVAFVIYLFKTTQPETSSWMDAIDYSFLSNNRISKGVSEIAHSKTTMYAVLLLAVMLLIQVPLLKNYFNKRLLN